MIRYLFRRALESMVVVVGVVLLVFVLVRLTGDPVLLLMPGDATAEQIADLRRALGLDQPLWIQLVRFVAQALQGDFGTSYRNAEPAMGLIFERVPATLALAGAALMVTLIIAVPLGVLSALKPDSAADVIGRGLALMGQAVPSFWLGIMLILIFSVRLRWLPPFGAGGVEHLVLPSVALGAYSVAVTSRLLRSGLIDVMHSSYIQTARSKGLSEPAIVMRHALRNAALPVVTVLGLQVGALLGGAVIIEYVFSYPGVGRLVLDAVAHRDYAVVQAFVVVLSLVIAIVNLTVDVVYALLDPRIRL
jgi:peptide/nickel transport system permease protein